MSLRALLVFRFIIVRMIVDSSFAFFCVKIVITLGLLLISHLSISLLHDRITLIVGNTVTLVMRIRSNSRAPHFISLLLNYSLVNSFACFIDFDHEPSHVHWKCSVVIRFVDCAELANANNVPLSSISVFICSRWRIVRRPWLWVAFLVIHIIEIVLFAAGSWLAATYLLAHYRC